MLYKEPRHILFDWAVTAQTTYIYLLIIHILLTAFCFTLFYLIMMMMMMMC